jgi:hypothetical protein
MVGEGLSRSCSFFRTQAYLAVASDFPEYFCGVTASDAAKATRPRRGPGSSRGPGLVKGEASHLSGRQTEYTRKAGRRNNADMGEGGSRLDGYRGQFLPSDLISS